MMNDALDQAAHGAGPERELGMERAGRPWVQFPGGELEGLRPRVMCPACRARAGRTGTLCFQCYRAELDRERALKAAGELDTATEARFQCTLPFEPVNRPRLDRLRAERMAERRSIAASSTGRFVDRQRRAQIAARRALQAIAAGANSAVRADMRDMSAPANARSRVSLAAAIHAAELQLPESWLPFVVSL
jgi:hypothetical protein